MKTALVIGITGNFGLEMALALKKQDWQVSALMRSPQNAPDWLPCTNVIQGSVMDTHAVEQACQGVDLIVYAANPQYHRWHQEALKMLEPVARVAERQQLKILFPGNVYNFSPQTERINETQPMIAKTAKGKLRVAMEKRLQVASTKGAKVLIVRAGDFLGPNTHLSWVDFIAKQKNNRVTFAMPHSKEHAHYWTYLPDLCANAALLAATDESEFEVYHDPGFSLKTGDWQQAFNDQEQRLKVTKFPWWFIQVCSVFNPMYREVLKMRYLWKDKVVLDGSKMKEKLGDQITRSSLSQVVSTLFLKPS